MLLNFKLAFAKCQKHIFLKICVQDTYFDLLNVDQAQPWIGLSCKTPFKCKSKACLDPPKPKQSCIAGVLCNTPPSPDYWQWVLDNTGTEIRNLSADDFDKNGISMTNDAGTSCMAIDAQVSQ